MKEFDEAAVGRASRKLALPVARGCIAWNEGAASWRSRRSPGSRSLVLEIVIRTRAGRRTPDSVPAIVGDCGC